MQRYHVFLEKKAFKQLEKLGEDVHGRIVEALHTFEMKASREDLTLQNCEDKNQYRLRIGKYRILFELRSERTIVVYAILSRKAAY